MRRALLLLALAGCQSRPSVPSPPRAEFLVSAGDSTYWVAAGPAGLRVRGSPILLARYGARFYEIYVADDDYSYPDALMVGERMYTRDIRSGDSTVVFADTIVARIALAYARAHPDDRPLEPDEETDAEPAMTATSELEVLGTLGPYISYEYHADVEHKGSAPWHSTRRGVLDLRTGKAATVADLFGPEAGRRLAETGRRAYETARDSMLGAHQQDRRASRALVQLRFDPTSFALEVVDDRPAVRFAVPGNGEGPAGSVVELEAVPVDAAWWSDLRGAFAQGTDSLDRWTRPTYRVLARYEDSGEVAQVSLADTAGHEWPLRAVAGPLHQIAWLDDPPLDSTDRRALTRAFDEAATYDERSRVASAAASRNARTVSFIPVHASFQTSTREPARNLRAHDARRREQPGPRVRWRHSVDDGQMRGDRRLSSLARERRDGVHRPGRFSRADLPR
jgi:hypothetical protein